MGTYISLTTGDDQRFSADEVRVIEGEFTAKYEDGFYVEEASIYFPSFKWRAGNPDPYEVAEIISRACPDRTIWVQVEGDDMFRVFARNGESKVVYPVYPDPFAAA